MTEVCLCFVADSFLLRRRRPQRTTQRRSSAASDVYKGQAEEAAEVLVATNRLREREKKKYLNLLD